MRLQYACAFVALALLCGCSGATVPLGRDTLRPLERVRVIRVVQESLAARGLRPEAGRVVRVAGRVSVDCDVPIAGSHDCVEDVAATAEGDSGGHVLFLDDRDFLYESDLDRTGPNHPTVGEVEDRVRRVALDFAVWLRGQGRR